MKHLPTTLASIVLALALSPALCLADEPAGADTLEDASSRGIFAEADGPSAEAEAPDEGMPDAAIGVDGASEAASATGDQAQAEPESAAEPASNGNSETSSEPVSPAAPEGADASAADPVSVGESYCESASMPSPASEAAVYGSERESEPVSAPDAATESSVSGAAQSHAADELESFGGGNGASDAPATPAIDADDVVLADSGSAFHADEGGSAATDTPEPDPVNAAPAAAAPPAAAAAPASAAATKAATTASAKPAATASAKPAAKQTVNAPTKKAATGKAAVKPAKAAKKAAAKPAKKAAKKVADKAAVLANNAVYYISTALKKAGKFVVSAADNSGKAKVNVVLAKKAKTLAQYWRAEYRGKGVYRFVNYAGGYCLAVKGTVKSKANVRVAKKGTLDWKVVKNTDGTFALMPATGKKTYLSVKGAKAKKGANIRLWDSADDKGQAFTFTKNKNLTKAYATGQTAKPGVVKVALSGTKLRVGVAKDSKADNAAAATAAEAKSLSQVFQLRYAGNGLYELQNANSGKLLSAYKNAKKAGTKVVQASRSHSPAQMWFLQKSKDGYQVLNAKSGLALGVVGGKAAAGKGLALEKPAADSATQSFSLTETQLIQDGTYVLQSAKSLPFVLGLKSNAKKAGANVQANRSRALSGEKFAVKYLGGGAYRITSADTKLSVDVAASSKKAGANVQLAATADKASQKWIAEVGDNGIMFESAASGKYLEVDGAQVKNGANVVQKAGANTAAQAWNILPSTWKFYAKASSKAMKYIAKAEEYEGWRYQWGGRSPSTSFDCAGLVMYCANKTLGTKYDLMNTNAEMLYNRLKHISAGEAKPGDLVFYRGTYGSDVNYISHVVIYVGNGYMYGAGDPIGYAPVNSIRNIKGKAATAVYARIK